MWLVARHGNEWWMSILEFDVSPTISWGAQLNNMSNLLEWQTSKLAI